MKSGKKYMNKMRSSAETETIKKEAKEILDPKNTLIKLKKSNKQVQQQTQSSRYKNHRTRR